LIFPDVTHKKYVGSFLWFIVYMERASKAESVFCNKRFIDYRVFTTRTLNLTLYATQQTLLDF